MSDLRPSEEKFEAHIEQHLVGQGYESLDHSLYDRTLCLIPSQILGFLQATQPEAWGKLQAIHESETESKILKRISDEIAKRGLLETLRNRLVDHGVYFDLCYFEPKSSLNPDHQKLHQKNLFTVVRQLHYSTQNENSLDLALFLNGIPIVTLELKNQLTGQNLKHSENQYKHDRDPREPLFRFKRCLVHFCVDNNKASMTTRLAGTKTVFLPYNQDLENPPVEGNYRTKYLWEDVLTPNSLLDILENFAHLATEKELVFNRESQKVDTKTKEILIFPRYHQRELILKFRETLKREGVGKNYLVQHTTGSGKSYSIGWLAHTLTALYRHTGDKKRMFHTIVVVTDRTVLDDQLRNTLRALAQTEGVVNAVEHGSKELQKFLEQGKDIIVTTIQKFPIISKRIAALGDRKFAVIIDEVHSSQSGELAKEMKKSLSKTGKNNEETLDYEDWLREEIRSRGKQDHISFFGFTGTPKEKTLELFGTKNAQGQFEPFHIYSMYQSVHEGFTLDVLQNYTTYKRYFKVKKIKGEDIEIPAAKGIREVLNYVDAHEMTIQTKVNIILDHWLNHASKEIKGQARGMIVTPSRKQCVRYFKEINRQLKERGLSFKCLVGFSGEVSLEGAKYTEARLNKMVGHEGADVPLGLKNPKFRLLVVANKFQTGFNEPLVQSMYVDKRLDGIQCVQTLSRLNRIAAGKTRTFVLDFVNEPEEIEKSFQRFYQSTMLEGETDPNRLYDLLRDIYDFHLYTHEDVNRFCEIFFDAKRDEGALHPILDNVVDQFKSIEEEETRENYRSKIQSYLRMYGYLSQIITFTDIELEKSFVFLKFLNKKFPKRNTERLDILDAIDLESLRIQKIHEQNYELIAEDAIQEPPNFDSSGAADPIYDLLSEIISQVNNTYGTNLTDDDRLDLSRLRKRLVESSEIKKYMMGNNSNANKKNYFKKQFEDHILDYVNEKFDFFKKMDENPAAKDLIFRLIYSDYQRSLGIQEEA